MDDMDIDYVVEVPDTPDRLISQSRSHNNHSPSAGSVEILGSANRGCHNWPRGIANGIAHNRRLSIRPPKSIGIANESMNGITPIIISPSDSSCTSQAHVPRKLKIYRSSENEQRRSGNKQKRTDDEQRRSFGTFDMDDGRASSDGSSFKSFDCTEKIAAMNLEGRYGRDSDLLPKSVQTPSKSFKGKEIANGSTSKASCSSAHHGKEIDLSSVSIGESPEKLPQVSRNVSSARSAGQKRLVRNGCISPHNIASKAKEMAVRNSSSNFGPSNDSPPCTILDEIVAEEENSHRIKGKGILCNISTRNPIIRSNEDHKGTADAAGDVIDGFEIQGGWRSTRNQLRSSRAGSAANICENVAEKINHPPESRSSSRSNYAEHKDSSLATSSHATDVNRIDGLQSFANTPIRRSKRPFISRHHATSSRLGSGDSEVMSVRPSEESIDYSSIRLQNRRQRRVLNSVIEISESSPEVTHYSPRIVNPVCSPDSGARFRQMEADEILARELQEQLYNESPMDEYMVQMLQQEEQNHVSSTSSLNRRPSVSGGARVTRSQRQLQPRSARNVAPRRGRSNNVSTRNQPSSRGSFRRSSMLLSRERGLHFPLDMDLDMRIDILEALEAAMGDFDDITRSRNTVLRIERDFNENDYEMLLALDENVRHAGTSSNQINSLPESKVQTEVSEEACAICLDNPKFGETIRHLPCLHKFHKDCIDPWLNRSTSCPVCKSSVT